MPYLNKAFNHADGGLINGHNPSILSHVSIGTNQFERAVAFYDKVLLTLAVAGGWWNIRCRCLWRSTHPEFGYKRPTVNLFLSAMGRISVLSPQLKKPSMLFHQAALAAGGLNDGAGSRPDYGEHDCSRSGWSVRLKLFWDMQLVQEPQRTCFQTLRKLTNGCWRGGRECPLEREI